MSRTPAPQLSTSTTITPSNQSSVPAQRPAYQAWDGKSRSRPDVKVTNSLSMLTEPYSTPTTPAFVYKPQPNQRHSPATCGEQNGPSLLRDITPSEIFTGTRRSLYIDDRRMSLSHDPGAPLSLQIPNQALELPKISPGFSTPEDRFRGYASSNTATSLPSIALLKEHAISPYDDAHGSGAASISTRLSCSCDSLRPLLYDAVKALLKIEESVQARRRGFIDHRLNRTDDSPVRMVQWIVDHLRIIQRDLYVASGIQRPDDATHTSRAADGLPSPGSQKRPGDVWERGESAHKRVRSDVLSDARRPSIVAASVDRVAHIDVSGREQPPGYSPAPTESRPSSAYPRSTTPSIAHHATRALSSPSSMTYPSPAGSSLPTIAAQSSVRQQHRIKQLPLYIHNASANFAASGYISDLQHQVTLKNLALQTLQSDYALVLQKLQEEKLKSQTSNKKSTVADQEINELTSKNEDLVEQVKQLASQLEHSEKKREEERLEARKEKDQWGRMLEMSTRLQAKVDAERQRLQGENETLISRTPRHERQLAEHKDHAVVPTAGMTNEVQPASLLDPLPKDVIGCFTNTTNHETTRLRQQVLVLVARIEAFKATLSQIRAQSAELDERARDFQQRSGALSHLAELALQTDHEGFQRQKNISGASPIQMQRQDAVDDSLKPTKAEPTGQKSPDSLSRPQSDILGGGRLYSTNFIAVSRANSLGSDELDSTVQPTTSTTEELMKTLGPTPPDASSDPTSTVPNYSFTPEKDLSGVKEQLLILFEARHLKT